MALCLTASRCLTASQVSQIVCSSVSMYLVVCVSERVSSFLRVCMEVHAPLSSLAVPMA